MNARTHTEERGELAVTIYHVGPRARTQVVRHGRKCLPLRYLISPGFNLHLIFT